MLCLDFDAELFGCGLNALPGSIAFGVTHAFDLIKSGNRVSHVGRVVQRFLFFLWKSKIFIRDVLPLGLV